MSKLNCDTTNQGVFHLMETIMENTQECSQDDYHEQCDALELQFDYLRNQESVIKNSTIQTLCPESKNITTQTEKVDLLYADVPSCPFQRLSKSLQSTLNEQFLIKCEPEKINVIELYNNKRSDICVKFNISIDKSFRAKMYIHGKEVQADNDI